MAGTFQTIVLVIAGLGLLISLIVVFLMIRRQNKLKWPPMVTECPDWWKASKDSTGRVVCANVQNLGKCSAPFYPDDAQYTGADGLCNKYKWATNCDIQWDGVTYGVENPCAASSSS